MLGGAKEKDSKSKRGNTGSTTTRICVLKEPINRQCECQGTRPSHFFVAALSNASLAKPCLLGASEVSDVLFARLPPRVPLRLFLRLTVPEAEAEDEVEGEGDDWELLSGFEVLDSDLDSERPSASCSLPLRVDGPS